MTEVNQLTLFSMGVAHTARAHERFNNYDQPHSWQYEIRLQNRAEDLKLAGLTELTAANLLISDFEFGYVSSDDKKGSQEVKHFIERHEWLGKMPMSVTDRFTARLRSSGNLAGVVVMATPNTFSSLLGFENRDLEKLIARGACISWSPKNLASWLIMQSIKWMVTNTTYRYFTAYSDPEAKELGTIYQACNFTYLGQKFGSGYQYLDPAKRERGWFGESGFSDRSQVIRYAKALGIVFQSDWLKFVGAKKNYRKINWQNIPEDVKNMLKTEREQHKGLCWKRKSPAKHKYVYILGSNRSETKHLKRQFKKNSPDKINLAYPIERGS